MHFVGKEMHVVNSINFTECWTRSSVIYINWRIILFPNI